MRLDMPRHGNTTCCGMHVAKPISYVDSSNQAITWFTACLLNLVRMSTAVIEPWHELKHATACVLLKFVRLLTVEIEPHHDLQHAAAQLSLNYHFRKEKY